MKVEDARRGVMIADALEELSLLARDLENIEDPNDGRRLVVSIEPWIRDDSGGVGCGQSCVEIDFDTMALLLPEIQRALRQEAERLGVEV